MNILVSAIGFFRSFVYMKWIDDTELGIISLVQTIMLFIGLFQIGLLNGGYRIFSLNIKDQQTQINNLLFTYIALLSGLLICGWGIFTLTKVPFILNNTLLLVALVCGVMTLTQNWLNNTLIGKQKIKQLNTINITAALTSLAAVPLVFHYGFYGALITLVAQPLMFITITLLWQRELRPTGWNFDLKLIKYVLSFGFIPFLAGIFVIINLQIERWSIAELLGVEALGQFYLVFLYSTLFVLVPTSLLSIFFPKAIYAYENKQFTAFNKILKKHVQLLIVYVLCVTILTIFVMPPLIQWILPNHSGNMSYVYYFLPGAIALTLTDPLAIILNSIIRLKPLLYGGIVATILSFTLIISSNHLQIFNLTTMAIIKSIVNLTLLVIYIIYIAIYYRKIFIK